jgi:hypothetical protein
MSGATTQTIFFLGCVSAPRPQENARRPAPRHGARPVVDKNKHQKVSRWPRFRSPTPPHSDLPLFFWGGGRLPWCIAAREDGGGEATEEATGLKMRPIFDLPHELSAINFVSSCLDHEDRWSTSWSANEVSSSALVCHRDRLLFVTGSWYSVVHRQFCFT